MKKSLILGTISLFSVLATSSVLAQVSSKQVYWVKNTAVPEASLENLSATNKAVEVLLNLKPSPAKKHSGPNPNGPDCFDTTAGVKKEPGSRPYSCRDGSLLSYVRDQPKTLSELTEANSWPAVVRVK